MVSGVSRSDDRQFMVYTYCTKRNAKAFNGKALKTIPHVFIGEKNVVVAQIVLDIARHVPYVHKR